jgi:hypothetical protein
MYNDLDRYQIIPVDLHVVVMELIKFSSKDFDRKKILFEYYDLLMILVHHFYLEMISIMVIDLLFV